MVTVLVITCYFGVCESWPLPRSCAACCATVRLKATVGFKVASTVLAPRAQIVGGRAWQQQHHREVPARRPGGTANRS